MLDDNLMVITDYESCDTILKLLKLPTDSSADETWYHAHNGKVEALYCFGDYMDVETRRITERRYDYQGNLTEELSYVGTRATPFYTENGVAYYLFKHYDETTNTAVFVLQDADGNVVKETTIYENLSVVGSLQETICVDGKYVIYHDLENGIYIYDRDLNLLGHFQVYLEYQTECFFYTDTSLFFYNRYTGGATYLYDIEKNTLKEIVPYKETIHSGSSRQFFYTKDAVYYICSSGVYVQRKDGVEALLYDFEKSYYSVNEFYFIGVLEQDRFLVEFTDAFTGEACHAILGPTEEAQRPKRRTLKMASVGFYSNEDNSNRRMLLNSIAYFNRNNDMYCVTLTDYDSSALFNDNGTAYVSDRYDERLKTIFERDLTSSVFHDLYVFGDRYDYTDIHLEEKGFFSDLSALAEEMDLLDSLVGAFTYHGEITALPFSVWPMTLLTTADILSKEEPLTYEKLLSVCDDLKDGESLFCDNEVYRSMTDILLGDFVDFQAKNCSFNDPLFSEMLSFLTDYENALFHVDGSFNFNADTPIVNNTHDWIWGNYTGLSIGEDMLAPLAEGRVKFMELKLETPRTLAALLYLSEVTGLDFNLCGYPSKDGGSIYMEPSIRMSVRADSENKDGAAAYIRALLSEEVQNQVAETAFPVTREAVEEAFIAGYYCYGMETQKLNPMDPGSEIRWFISLVRTAAHPLRESELADSTTQIRVSQEQRDALVSYICNSMVRTNADETVHQIVKEELSAAAGGVRSIAEAAKIIQSRVFIYINE